MKDSCGEALNISKNEEANSSVKKNLNVMKNTKTKTIILEDDIFEFEKLSLVQILVNSRELNCPELEQKISEILKRPRLKEKQIETNGDYCDIYGKELAYIVSAVELIKKSEINFPLEPTIMRYTTTGQFFIKNTVNND